MGILKKKRKQAEKPTKAELQSILADYKRQTAEITDETAMDMMDTEKKNDFLLLLKVADYTHMGKSRAILTAFKLGYLQGQKSFVPGLKKQDTLFEVIVQLKKASTVLGAIIGNYGLEKMNLTESEMIVIGSNASNICDLAAIASDYVSGAKMDLEWIME